MKTINKESLNKVLLKLESIGGIIGTAVVNRNGLLIASRLPRNINDRKFSAMAATMFGAIETATTTLGSKKINNLTVELDDYQIIALEVDEQIMIVSLLDININLGLILIEIEEIAKKIEIILSS